MQKIALSAKLSEFNIRFNSWRIFLGIMPSGTPEEIKAAIDFERQKYQNIVKEVKITKNADIITRFV